MQYKTYEHTHTYTHARTHLEDTEPNGVKEPCDVRFTFSCCRLSCRIVCSSWREGKGVRYMGSVRVSVRYRHIHAHTHLQLIETELGEVCHGCLGRSGAVGCHLSHLGGKGEGVMR